LILLEKLPAGGRDKIIWMTIAITLSLVLVTALTLVLLRVFRPGFSFAWPIAVIGSFLAWISVFLWQLNLPDHLVLFDFKYLDVINYSISLASDGVNYPYVVGISSLVMAAIFTSAMKAREANPLSWVTILLLSIIGLIAVLAENPLTLVIAWSFMDLAGIISSLNSSDDPIFSQRAVLSFSTRVIGTGLVLWAGIISTPSLGGSFTQSAIQHNPGVIIILGVIIRSFALFIPHPYSRDTAIRNGIEATYKLISAAATVVMLSRVRMDPSIPLTIPLLIVSIAITGLISVYGWLRNPREIFYQSNWILGLITLSISATLMGNPLGSAAWGSACLFAGGLLFFYSHRNRVLTVSLLIAVYILSSFPYSITATGWSEDNSKYWITLIILIPLQSLLTAGYIRSIVREEKDYLNNQPRWVIVIYSMGLVSLALSGLILGVMGWEGASQMGAWIPAAIAAVLTATSSFILIRIPIPAPLDSRLLGRPIAWAGSILTVSWGLYRTLRRLLDILTTTFEGDGGVLWTILFLIVFISILGVYAF
jgi:hypothetical protein